MMGRTFYDTVFSTVAPPCGVLIVAVAAAIGAFTAQTDSIVKGGMAGPLVRKRAKNDPEAALKWTENLSAEKQLPARQSVLSEWIASRPDAASEWVRGLPAGEERSAGGRIVSASLSGEKARTWRESLPAQERETIK